MRARRFTRIGLLLGAVLAVGLAGAQDDVPDRTEPLPDEFEGVGITERLDNRLPLDAEFTDEEGRPVKLGDYFDGKRPVVLVLNYFRCPQLCGLLVNALVDGMSGMDWTPGTNFQVLTVSFDPLETPQLAKAKKQGYLQLYGRREAASGWHFLVGPGRSVNALLDATGYEIRWSESRREWIHLAAVMVVTPDGRISRYLYGLLYDPKTLRLSLVEASEGKIGTTMDRILLYCFHFDAASGSYVAASLNLMGAAALLVALVVGLFLWSLWRWERRRRATPVAGASV